MADRKNLELRVGGAGILAILILVLGSMWGKDITLARRYRQVSFLFENSGGLRPGDPATVNGVKKGRVELVTLRGKEVVVTASLDNDVQLFADATARISMLDFMGGHKLEILPGKSSTEIALNQLTEPIQGMTVVGMGEMLAEAVNMKTKVDTVLTSLQETARSLSKFTGDERMQRNIRQGITNLSDASESLRRLLDQNERQLTESAEALHAASTTVNKLIQNRAAGLDSTLQTIGMIVARLDTFSRSLQTISEKFDRREGTLAQLIYNDETYDKLQQTMNAVDSLAIDLRRNLGKYLSEKDIKLINLIDF